MLPSILFVLISYHFTGNFDDPSVYYHLVHGVSGAGFAEYWFPIALSLLVVLFCLGFSYQLYKKQNGPHSRWWFLLKPVPFIALLAAIIVNPSTFSMYTFYKRNKLSTFEMVEMTDEFQQYFHESHISPNGQPIKNLVFIYAESLERTYFNESVFPGLMTELKALRDNAIDFTDVIQLSSTSWTIAGIVASQCGLPLVLPSSGNAGIDLFYPKAVCLSDLLKRQNYHLHHMAGTDKKFAGMNQLLETHGFDQIEGKHELIDSLDDPDYQSYWGLYDDSLYDLFFQRYLTLSAQEKPFMLTTITVDTHNPVGHESASCKTTRYLDGKNPLLNAVKCADWQLAKLIRKIQTSDAGKDTVVVLVSDHYARKDSTSFNLLNQAERRNLFMLFPPDLTQGEVVEHRGSNLDTGATVLPFIGFEGRISLGRDLYHADAQVQQEIKDIHQKSASWTAILASFWQFPTISEGVAIDQQQRQIEIAERQMKAPVLLAIDDELQVIPYFDFDAFLFQPRLTDRFLNINDRLLVLIDECSNVAKLVKVDRQHGLCLLVSKDRETLKVKALDKALYIDVKRIKGWLES